MKVVKNRETEAFFRRCRKNLENDRKNAFLGMTVTAQTEDKVRRDMGKAGIPEFAGSKEQWPSLFLSSAQYCKTPYHANIDLPAAASGNLRYERLVIPAGEIFNAEAIHKDPERELNDWMRLRAMDEPLEAGFLYEGEKVWMMDSPSEALTNDPPAEKAHGKVITFGLGIGYFVYMALLNPAVESVTVVEQSPEVIRLFEQYVLPKIQRKDQVRIIEGDAFDCFTEEFLKDFDYIYADIWQSGEDGLEILAGLLPQYLPEEEKADFWIEDTIMETVWTISCLHMEELCYGKRIPVAADLEWLHDLVVYHFEKEDRTVSTEAELKDLIYDRQRLRRILAGR